MIKRYSLSIGITALLYFLVAKLVFVALQLGIEPAPLWPPAGVGLFMLLQQGRHVWPGVTLGILLVGQWLGVSLGLAVGSALGGTLQAIVGAVLLQRSGFERSMNRLPDVLRFIGFAAIVAPALNATIGTGTRVLMQQTAWSQIESTWWVYWLGDGMGVLVFTPLLLILAQAWRSRSLLWQGFTYPRLPELLFCFTLLIGLSAVVFHSHLNKIWVGYPIEYLPFPLVIWAALRLGQPFGIVASFLLCMFSVTGTIADRGPFLMVTTVPHQLLLLQQAFLGVITMTALIVGAIATERRQIEALLRSSQTSLAKAQQVARLGRWEFDFDHQQWRWSDELYRLLGLAVNSIPPSLTAFLQAIHPDDRAPVQQALSRVFEDRVPYRMDYRLRLPDGTERVIEEQTVISAQTATGTILDITEYKQTEEKLRLNAERNRLLNEIALRIRRSLNLNEILNTTTQEVRQLLQADRVFICQFDRLGNGAVVAESVLPGWTSALGWTSDADVYPEIQSIFAESHICIANDTAAEEYTPFVQYYHDRYQVKAGLGVAILEEAASVADSAVHPFNAQFTDQSTNQSADQFTDHQSTDQFTPPSNAPSNALSHRLFGLIIVHQCSRPRQWQPLEIELLEQLATQVSIAIQQGQLYQQVQHLNSSLEQQVTERTRQLQVNLAKLEDMNQLQDVFLHAIAHDLRTSVIGTLMLLNNFQQQPGDVISIPRSMLERMSRSGEIQLCKLNSLLEVYTNKTEGIRLAALPMQFAHVVKMVICDLQPLLEQNQATIDCDLPELPILKADPEQVERVLRHLLVNAIKHNPPGVHIHIQVESDANGLRCIVADNGRGIAPAEMPHLFELKIGNGSDRQRTGISVGLCLCQQIVAAHGGAIGVETALGQGSRFWFTLPLDKE